MKRHSMSGRASRKSFTKHAVRVHKKNHTNPMRGGIRA